jgi:hypothetical protein
MDNGAMRISIYSTLLLLSLFSNTHAQYCNPASVSLVLHNQAGEILTEADVKNVASKLPKDIGDANIWVGEAWIAPDNKTFYWEEDSEERAKAKKLPALNFSNSGTCTMHLTEATLDYNGLKLHLVFNIDIARDTKDRRPVIIAPRFQTGTFRLDLTGWSHDPKTLIPATRWKRVKS